MLVGCTLSLVACLGMGFSASLVSHTKYPGCGGIGVGPRALHVTRAEQRRQDTVTHP